MKKGCFIQGIIVLTILTAAVIYIVQNHLHDLVLNPAKKELTRVILDDFDQRYKFIPASPEKDTFRIAFKSYLEDKFRKDRIKSGENIEEFFDSVKPYIMDSVIDKSDLIEIKKIAGITK